METSTKPRISANLLASFANEFSQTTSPASFRDVFSQLVWPRRRLINRMRLEITSAGNTRLATAKS